LARIEVADEDSADLWINKSEIRYIRNFKELVLYMFPLTLWDTGREV